MYDLLLYPQLKQPIRLKKRNCFVVLFGNHPSQLSILHPSEAFVLNFCTGRYSFEDLKFLYSKTYRISKEKASDDIKKIIASKRHLMNFTDHAVSNLSYFKNPVEYLYKSNENEFAAFRESYFLASLNLSLTLTCNFNCRYCCRSLNKSEERLDLYKCLTLIDEAAENDLIHFGLTGGEPTLFSGWITLVQCIIEHDMVPNITTNGSIIGTSPLIARKLRNIGLTEITISLDASNADLHHFITKSTNSFTKVINAIQYLLKNNIQVKIKYVLSTLNIFDLSRFIDFVAGLGVQEIDISNLENGAKDPGTKSALQISRKQYDKALLIIEEKKHKYQNKCIIHPPSHSTCLTDKNTGYPCGGLSMRMSIFPNGDVTICDKLFGVKEFTYGNVFTDSLYNIWHSDTLQKIREKSVNKSIIDKGCSVCMYLKQCKTGCFVDSFNAFGYYYKKTPRCKGPFYN